jgi:microcystin-dependent protein
MNEFYIGQIQAFAFGFAPKGWLPCNGQLLSISQNSALFNLIGTTYGGDGHSTFALPDLRGRVSFNCGQGQGLSNYAIGQKGGQETVQLSEQQMPIHSHAAVFSASSETADNSVATNRALGSSEIYAEATPNDPLHAGTVKVSPAGGSLAHENRPPYIALNYCIAVTGYYPYAD